MTDLPKKWLPSSYQGEFTPPPRNSPNDWICTHKTDDDTTLSLEAADYFLDESGRLLADGDIVNFGCTVTLGRRTLTIRSHAEGDWTLDAPEPDCPAGFDLHVWLPGDSDTVSLDVDTLVDCRDVGSEIVEFYAWSDSIPFIFHDGKFHEVTP